MRLFVGFSERAAALSLLVGGIVVLPALGAVSTPEPANDTTFEVPREALTPEPAEEEKQPKIDPRHWL